MKGEHDHGSSENPSTVLTITALEPAPDDPNQRRICVGSKIVATLPAQEVMRLGIAVGDQWSEAVGATIREAAARMEAHKVALRVLGRRGYSRRGLLDRLTASGVEPGCAESVVAELEHNGWIDDRLLATDLARSLLRRNPAGPDLIVRKLEARGIDPSLARATADESLQGIDLIGSAEGLARRRLRSIERADPASAARRVASALARRGFDDDVVREVLRRLRLDGTGDSTDLP